MNLALGFSTFKKRYCCAVYTFNYIYLSSYVESSAWVLERFRIAVVRFSSSRVGISKFVGVSKPAAQLLTGDCNAARARFTYLRRCVLGYNGLFLALWAFFGFHSPPKKPLNFADLLRHCVGVDFTYRNNFIYALNFRA